MKKMRRGLQAGETDSVRSWQAVPEGETEDAELIALLQAGLDDLDKAVPVFEPSPQWIEAQLDEHEGIIRKRFIRDITLFLTAALAMLSGMAAAYFKLPSLFLLLHTIGFLSVPLVLFGKGWKKVKDR
jgi:hypothetical protein